MKFFRENVLNLKGYKPSEIPYEIKLDANESPFKNISKELKMQEKDFKLNFYPDSNSTFLREEISKYLEIKKENVIVGNGSSEMIDLIMKTFIDKGDKILGINPSFSMYKVYSEIYSGEYQELSCEKDFSIPVEKIIENANRLNPKMILLCNPNNPTGKDISKKDIIRIIENTNSLVVIDEAYIEFGGESVVSLVDKFKNLVVIRTFSKAFGLAGARVGYMISNEESIQIIDRVRPPYNLNKFSQYAAIIALKDKDSVLKEIEGIKARRKTIYEIFKAIGIEAYESKGNFVFFKMKNTNNFNKFVEKGILIRKFSGNLEGYYRVSIGSNEEVNYFIKIIKEIF